VPWLIYARTARVLNANEEPKIKWAEAADDSEYELLADVGTEVVDTLPALDQHERSYWKYVDSRKIVRLGPTCVMLIRLSPDAKRSPSNLDEFEKLAMRNIRAWCEGMEWLWNSAVLGGCYYATRVCCLRISSRSAWACGACSEPRSVFCTLLGPMLA
jgi:hypothetical protein